MVAYAERPSSDFDWSGFDAVAAGLPDSFEDVCVRYLEPMLESVGDDVYVACLATDPPHRGRGVATALLEALFEMVGDRDVSLDVLADNETAIRLYSRLGFCPCGDVSLGYAHAVEDSPWVISMRRTEASA
jgi:ribosomal protein S18 acetylase RimI-like enzyme